MERYERVGCVRCHTLRVSVQGVECWCAAHPDRDFSVLWLGMEPRPPLVDLSDEDPRVTRWQGYEYQWDRAREMRDYRRGSG